MLMGVTVAASSAEAATPSTGKLTLSIYYSLGGTPVAGASNSTYTQVSYSNGYVVQSQSGQQISFTLDYGSYVVNVAPQKSVVLHNGTAISNGLRTNVTITSSTPVSKTLLVPVTVTHVVKLTVGGIASGQSAKVSFRTDGNFQFIDPMTVYSNGTYNVSLPSGAVTATVTYAGNSYNFEQVIGQSQATLDLNIQTGTGLFGNVYSTSGSPVSGVTAVILNDTSNSYSVSKFSGSYYSVYSNNWTTETLILGSNGYAPDIISGASISSMSSPHLNVNLTPESSTVYYNYSLSSDMKTIDLNITYMLGPGTTIPQLPNAAVNSLAEQLKLDNIDTAYMTAFLQNLMLKYTNDSIMIANTSYALIGTPSVHISNLGGSPSAYFNASVTAQFTNATIKASSLKSGFQAKIYAFGTTYSSGALYTNYSFAYNNTNIALSSSTVKVNSYVSPILIPGQKSSGWIYLNFGPVKAPKFYNTQIKLDWKGLKSTDYLLNTSDHPAFIVPLNTSVSFNMSKALYNPVTGSYDYLPPANFTWTIGSATGYGYNFSHVFTSLNTTVHVNGTSSTGNVTSTFFTVYAYNGTPTLNYSVSYKGAQKYNGTVTTSSVNITVPQSSIITFSLYNSTIKIPDTANMSVPLLYNWTFNDSSFASPNVTYIFQEPSIKVPNQKANVTVTGITGGSRTFSFDVYVNDTTRPTPVITMKGPTGKNILNPVAGQVVNFSASKSSDPYFNSSYPLIFHWSFHYPNGTKITNTSGIFYIKYGNLNNTSVGVVFRTLNTVIVELSVTNNASVTGYLNTTLTMLVNSPRIVVDSIYVQGSLQQGKTSTIYVNVTNKGSESASSFSIAVLVGGVVKYTQNYLSPLNKSQTRNISFSWNPDTSGSSLTVQFVGNNTSEPAFFAKLGGYTTTVNIGAPGYKTPLIAAGIVAVIVVVGIVYWRLSSGGFRRTKPGEQHPKSKVSLPSEQKKLEKKK